MKRIFLLLTLATSTIFAQAPANDACSGAINLGTLATANGACPGSGVVTGVATTAVGTSANATTENPYNTVINCEGGAADMASPAIDVWYTFTSASGSANALQVAITNFPGVHFAVYEAPAGNCTGLVPRGCSLDGAITVEPIQASTVFYLQVSGNTAALTDPSFNLSIKNNFNCDNCFTAGEITANPLPVNGAYSPGQTVNFCFHVDKYTEVSVNWLHGIQLGLGSGWNAASVVASPATAWGPNGTWNYYPGGITSDNNGALWPKGWYFNRTGGGAGIGGTGTAGDSNPGNNWGDEASTTGTAPANVWNFCFNVTTAAVCSPGSDLSVTFNTSGDGESGFYGSLACTTDPPITFLAQGACCPPTMASTSLTCFGDATGSATATPVGAGAPFIYNWSGPSGYTNTSTGAGASVISGLAAGVYTLSTKDVNLCERITTVTVTQPTSVTATPSSTNATCLALGSAAVVAGGGVPGYTYSWLPSGGTGATASGLSAGIYTVTVRDSKLCPRTATVNITSTGTVTSGFTGAGTRCLTGNTFTFTNTGTAAATHNWSFSPVAGAPAASTATNYGVAAFTAAGTYTVSHTVTNGVCVNTTTQVVVVNPNPAATLSPTNPVCSLPNGIININNTSLGVQTVTLFASSVGTVTGQQVTGISGTVTPVITLTNDYGCTFTISTPMVNQPGPTNFALTSTITGCAAPTGAIAFNTPVGGTGGFTYSHNSGAFTATSPITGLAAGIQTVTVKDNNGCTFTKTITVGAASSPTAITGNTTAAACGANNGSYTLTGISGGTPTYSYNLNGGALTTASVVSSLAAGSHPVSVTDANGCTFATTFTIGSLSGPSAVTVTAIQPSCGLNNGTATISPVVGGALPLSYSFDGAGFVAGNSITGLAAGNHTATVKDNNGCELPVTFSLTNPGTPTANIVNTTSVACNAGATGAFTVSATGGTTGYTYSITPTGAANPTGLFSGLTAQTYTVRVFDGAGCTYTLTNTISQPTAVTLTLTPLAVSCNGGANGTVTATAGGGSPAYNFAIDGGATQASGVFAGLTSGVHSVIVRDLNNCPLTTTVNVAQPAALALGFTVTPTACVGATGTATIGVTGGTPVYNYSVDAVATSSLPSSLAFGSHTISVTDNNGCPISTTFNTPMVSGPTSASIVASNATCGSANATATVVSVTGGGGTNTFNFDNAGFTVSNTVGSLAAGSHTVVIKDVNQCTLTANYNVNNTGSPTSNVIATNSVTCFGGNNGGFSVNTAGGSPGYSYTLTPGGIVNTTGVFTGLTAQNYNVTVKDGVGCATSVTNTIIEPTALTLSLTPTHLLCNGISSGSIAASGAGGTGTLNYSINNGVFGGSSNFTSLPAATHTIVVRDVNTCTLSAQVILTQPAALTLTTTTTPNSCNGAVGSATFAVNGGVTAYSYSVDAVAVGNNTPSGLSSATHSVTVKDNNGCLIGASFTVGTVTGPSAMTFTTTNSTCGNTNGTATVTSVTGGLSTYQYSYDGGAFTTNNFISSLGAGTHTVTVLDANSCTLTATYNVLNTGSPAVNIVGATPALCFGGATGSFTASASGGSGTPYTYSITSAAGTNTTGVFGGLLMNVYTVVAKDAVGCAVQTTVQITEPTPVTVTVSSVPAKCNGAANGTITVTGMGGAGSYSTSLNGSGYLATNTYSTVGMGFYNVNILDGNNCPAATTVQVTQPAALNISISTQNANCSAPNGLASATVTGGSGGYSYAWSGGAGSSSTTNPVVSGNYTLNVTDVNSCTATAVANIGLVPGGTAVISNTTAISCFNGCDGTITADMPTGAAPVSYVWSNGQAGPTATGLCAGTYSCNVTDFYGCKATVGFILVNPPILNATVSAIPVKCFSEATGTVSSGATGGTGAYTFLWTSNGGTTAIVPNVFAGTHTVIVTDAKNCSTTQTVLVTQPTAIALTATATTANCNQADGSATVTANGGAGGYTYTWPSPIPSGSSISGQLAGTYTVNVSDANGCIETLAATIPNSAGPSVSISTKTDVACFNGNTGAATAAVTGGSGNFTYLWSPSNATGATAANLFMGVHTVTITDNVSGCRATTSVTITEPPVLTASTVPTHPKCTGSIDGFGFVVATGGTSPYTYTWTAGGGNNATSNNYGAGNYAVTVKDNNGCLVITPLTLIDPALMLASTIHTNVSCFGTCNGVAIASTTNAIAPVNYSWVGGSSPVPSQTLTGACATNYTLTATDFNGCVAKSIVNITQPPLLTANIASSGSVTCRDGNDGFATVSPGGGTVGYTFSWSNISATGTTASSLTAGVYTVTVTDALNCRASDVVTILEPAPLVYNLGVNNPRCFGDCSGTGTVSISGGSGAVSLLWLPNLTAGNFANNLCVGPQTLEMTYNGTCKTIETFTLTEPNQIQIVMTQTNSTCGFANGNAHAAVTGGVFPYTFDWSNGIPSAPDNYSVTAGAYTFTVTDFNGCKEEASALINDITGPVVAVTQQTNVSCYGGNNGSAYATVNGGTPTYTINWDGGTPASSVTQSVTGLPAGLYNITVKDILGCVGSSSVLITQPPILNTAITQYSNVSCFNLTDGSATISHNGGSPNYSYLWLPAVANNSVAAVTGLGAGTYTAIVTDQNGCSSSKVITITQPAELKIVNVTTNSITCNGSGNGSIDVDATGGTAPYNYTWTPTNTNSDFIFNLAQGGYSVYIADTRGCNTQTIVSIQEPPLLTASISSSVSTCGLANGAATITTNGGTIISPSAPYTYNWSTPTAATTSVVTGLASGIVFNCITTDKNGCNLTQTVMITAAPQPTITSITSTMPKCFGGSDGTITMNYAGGAPNYVVNWQNPIVNPLPFGTSALTQSVSGVTTGVWTATLTDTYGCKTNSVVIVDQPQLLTVDPSTSYSICYGQQTQISATAGGGTFPYTYTWTSTIGTPLPNTPGPHLINTLTNATFSVTIDDANGCGFKTKVISINVGPPIIATPHASTVCHNDAATLIPTITSPGNGGPYSYTWTPAASGSTNVVIGNYALSPQHYTLTVGDGCSLPSTPIVFTVNVNPLPTGSISVNSFTACSPANGIVFTAVSNNPTSDTYNWDINKAFAGTGVQINPQLTNAGTYIVDLTITNLFGCSNAANAPATVTVFPAPTASFVPNPRTVSIIDPTVEFTNVSQGATDYLWEFGDPSTAGQAINTPNANSTNNTINPNHTYNFVGTYNVYLQAISSMGCTDVIMIPIEVTPDFSVFIPNAFTPCTADGACNGINDVFYPKGVGINEDNYRLDIFDRWGENIFTSTSFRKGWDGSVKGSSKIAQQGVYIYKLLVYDLQGNKHPFVGHVTLIKGE